MFLINKIISHLNTGQTVTYRIFMFENVPQEWFLRVLNKYNNSNFHEKY